MPVFDVSFTILTVLLTAGIAIADFARADFVLTNSTEVGVPRSWLPFLGTLKLLGAVGLCVGVLAVDLIGVLAAGGLTAFFVGAIITHVRAGVFHNLAFPLAFLALAAGSLVLAVAR